MNFAEKIFHPRAYGSSVKKEILAGLTTFMAMAYIVAVNPGIMAAAGVPEQAAFAATVWASVLPTLFMAFAANLPIALAPGMGVNAFFTYTLVLGMGLSWQNALGAVFLSGLLFLALAFTPLPALIVRSVPANIKLAVGAGIGLFIALIGFQGAGLTVANPETMLAVGDLTAPSTLLACAGLAISAVLMARGVPGAILIGILASAALGMFLGVAPAPQSAADLVSLDVPGLGDTFLAMELKPILSVSFLSVLFTMTMVDMFNAMGTVIGLSGPAQLAENTPQGPRIRGFKRAMMADAGGTLLGGLLGTSPVTSYLESITGIAEGGRTGLTALTVALLMALCLFFAPAVGMLPGFATAPALILVGALMMSDISRMDISDMTESLPALLCLAAMPLTYSIVTGFGLAFISYAALKACTGRAREVSAVVWLLAAAFLLHFTLA